MADTEAKVKEIIINELGVEAEKVTPEASFVEDLGADSLRYLPIESISRAVDRPADELCRACITGRYPTVHGQKLYEIALANAQSGAPSEATGSRPVRTYETPGARV